MGYAASSLAFSRKLHYVQGAMKTRSTTGQQWRLIQDGPRSGSENMAVDEELLRAAEDGDEVPTLRLYAWRPAAVSLGRFQDERTAVREDACRRLGIDIVRRATGGRAVLHDDELTYGIVARTGNRLFPQDVLGAYKVIANGLLRGLANLGIPAEMVGRSCANRGMVRTKNAAPACFSSPSWYEILVNGKKIIGSAQRRLPHAFLQHGSVLIGYDAAREAAVIPGGSGGRVTCITEQLNRPVPLEDVRAAFVEGFRDALGLDYR